MQSERSKSSDPRPERPTYEDLQKLPDHLLGQIVDGELYAVPRPPADHQLASSVLGRELGSAFLLGCGGPGGWLIVDEPEFHLGRQVLVPDLAGWRRERMPTVPREPFFTLSPDRVCRELSPSTARLDRRK